jgi:polyisoprenoid-binding protein YceI
MIHPALLHVPTPNWAALAWSMPYGWYEPPPPPDPSDLPPPGRYHLDPARSSVRVQVRGLRRWQAGSAGVTGTLRFARGSAAVELTVETAGLRSGDPERDRKLHGLLDPPSFPLVRFTATELAAAHGAWLVPGQVTLRGRAVPVALWIDPVDRLPDGTITVGLRGTLERRASGFARRVALELTLVAAPEPVSFAPPCVAASRPAPRSRTAA